MSDSNKILQLIDKYGNIVRSKTFGCDAHKKLIQKKWKKLYANNTAFQESTYNIIANDYIKPYK